MVFSGENAAQNGARGSKKKWLRIGAAGCGAADEGDGMYL